MNKKRKVRIQNEFGRTEYVNIDDIISPQLQNTYLDDHVLDQIKTIHEQLKDVLQKECPKIALLEHFETSFMRDIEPDIEINLWSRILQAYYELQNSFGNDFETRCLIFRYIIMYIGGSLTKEEQQREDISKIIEVWEQIFKRQEF